MNTADLTVLMVAANENANGGLIMTALKSIQYFSESMPNVLIADNGVNGVYLDHASEQYGATIIKNTSPHVNHYNTSFRHGSGLNALYPHVSTTYTAIIEPDCAVLNKKWLELDSDIKAAPRGKTYHISYIVFKTKMFENMDWEPDGFDTAGRMRHVINKNNTKFMTAKKASEVLNHPIFIGNKTVGFFDDDELMAAHFYRGSELGRRRIVGSTSPMAQAKMWKKYIEDYIAQHGEQE